MSSHRTETNLGRRGFLKAAMLAGGTAALAPWLKACAWLGLTPASQPPAPTHVTLQDTPAPGLTETSVPREQPAHTSTATEEPGTARLAFVKTRDRAAGVRQALQLLGADPVGGKAVVIKPNLNSADPAPASTSPETLRALVESLWGLGARQITLADRSGMGHSRDVMQRLGIFDMAGELGFETRSFEDLTSEEQWAFLQPAGSHWQTGFPFARLCLEAEALVSTCCLKPHRFGGHFTLSLKNSVGMAGKYYGGRSYNYMTELHSSPDQRLMIAEINTAYSPALIVLDGVEAFVDQGPETGTRVWGEAVIAGTDRLAVDAVGLALLRMLGYGGVAAQGPIFQQDQIRRAAELGLGVASPDKIRLAAPDEDSRAYAARVQEVLLQSS
jgi:uncharacterized protein (DUF362 family)